MHWRRSAVLFFLVLALSYARAQKGEIGFVAGASIVSDAKANFLCVPSLVCQQPVTEKFRTGHQFSFQGVGAYRLTDLKAASLYLELPVVGIPSQRVTLSGFCCTIGHLTTTFVTPSFRAKLLPKAPISPFVSIGAGWGRYSFSQNVTNKGALQYGGGLDVNTRFSHLALRFEVRDFVTGDPTFIRTNSFLGGQGGLHHHNVLPGGGIVFNF